MAADGDMFVTQDGYKDVYRFDGQTGEPLGVEASVPNVQGIAFGPEGRLYVAAGSDGSVWRFDGHEGRRILEHLDRTTGLALGPDGNMYVGTSGGAIWKFDPLTGQRLGQFAQASDGVSKLAFGPDGHLYVTTDYEDAVFRWNGRTGQYMGEFTRGGDLDTPRGMAFGPDGHLYVTSINKVVRYDGQTGEFLDVFIDGRRAGTTVGIGIAFGPDADLYVSARNGVWKYDGATGEPIKLFARLRPSGRVIFSGQPRVECDRIRRLKAKCGHGAVTAVIKSDLAEGTRVYVANNKETFFTRIDGLGRGKVRFENQTNEPHEVSIPWCPDVACSLVGCEGDKCRD